MNKKTDNIEKLNDSNLSKVAGGFETARPLHEIIRSNLKSEEKFNENADKASGKEHLI